MSVHNRIYIDHLGGDDTLPASFNRIKPNIDEFRESINLLYDRNSQ